MRDGLAGAAALPREVPAEGSVARLPRRPPTTCSSRDLSALAGESHETIQGTYRPLTYFQLMEISLRELLVEKGIVTDEQVDAEVEAMRERSPSAARGWWRRPGWIATTRSACWQTARQGLRGARASRFPALKLVVVENTPQVHNAIVCTLCSCYPRMLLGIPPDWYKSRNYRSRMVREPRAVLAEFGLRDSRAASQIRVHDSTADMRYLVLPMRPAGTEGWSEERLAALVTRDCMIGVAVPKVHQEWLEARRRSGRWCRSATAPSTSSSRQTLDLEVNAVVQRLAAMVHARALPWLRDVVPALGGLALHFDPDHPDVHGDALEAARDPGAANA